METLSVPIELIKKYLVFWEEINDNKKAFSKDEYPIKNEWSLIDFLRKFGIEYPDFGNPKNVKLVNLIFEKGGKKEKKWLERLTKR